MTRPPDLAWEALVEATNANPAMERGKLNAALKAIREAALRDGIHEDSLPDEIFRRAAAYRESWPGLTLTPTALATHWFRVIVKPVEQRSGELARLDDIRRRRDA